MSIRHAFSGLALLLLSLSAWGQMVMVTNPANPTSALPLSHLTRLYLGQTNRYPDGSTAVVLDVSGGARKLFYSEVLKKAPDQVEKYWARMIFTGKSQPPREIGPAEAKTLVAATPGAISYMDASKVDSSVKVLHIDTSH